MARKMEDLTGQRFGRLVAIGGYDTSSGVTKWDFQCDCGVIKTLPAQRVKTGSATSCGCLRSDASRERATRHGMSRTPVHAVWATMIARCTLESNKSYPNYGGRGIKVCDRWKKFENFLADMGEPQNGMTLERDDNDGNYELGNCRWATRLEQTRNRRNTIFVEYNGSRMCLPEVAELAGVDYELLYQRYYKGWPLELAISTPKGPVGQRGNNPFLPSFKGTK